MGVGVFTKGEGSLTFIIPFDEYVPDEDREQIFDGNHDLHRIRFEETYDTIMSTLPDSFEPEDEWDGRYTKIIARNGFVNVGLTEWECNDLYISFWPRDDDDRYDWGINPLAYKAIVSAHDKCRARLGELFSLRIRTSSYTTGKVA